MSGPLIVSALAGPGTGKSTTMTEAFSLLKKSGVNCEYVPEAAKHFTWRRDWKSLGHQGLLHGLQTFEYDMLEGEVDCILTDTSPLLSIRYGRRQHASQEFRDYVLADWEARNMLTIFLERDPERAYNPAGRRQDRGSAEAEDAAIKELLVVLGVPFESIKMSGGNAAAKVAWLAADRL